MGGCRCEWRGDREPFNATQLMQPCTTVHLANTCTTLQTHLHNLAQPDNVHQRPCRLHLTPHVFPSRFHLIYLWLKLMLLVSQLELDWRRVTKRISQLLFGCYISLGHWGEGGYKKSKAPKAWLDRARRLASHLIHNSQLLQDILLLLLIFFFLARWKRRLEQHNLWPKVWPR